MKAHLKVIGTFLAFAGFVAVGVRAPAVPVLVVTAGLLVLAYWLLLDVFRSN